MLKLNMYSRSLQMKNLPRRLSSFFPTISITAIARTILQYPISNRHYHHVSIQSNFTNSHKPTTPPPENPSIDQEALEIETLLKLHSGRPTQEISRKLDDRNIPLSQELVLNVLKRHRSDWKPAHAFFSWVRDSTNPNEFSPDASVHNETLDILGRARRFQELRQVLDEMSVRKKSLINDRTFGIVVNRLAAAHKVDEAIDFFNSMEGFGLDRDSSAFQTLLLSLCRHKHVEDAEAFFRRKRNEFKPDIKTWNIILNGWCLLRSLPDSKRLWKDILESESRPDKFTYAVFINSLTKSGKTTTSTELLRSMWAQGLEPDVTICNTVVDGLCFKKRIPEAFRIMEEMVERGCSPNVSTYNTLIKHMCKIRRMEKVEELLREMEEKGFVPNLVTFSYLLKAAKNREEVDGILERMKRSGCEMEGDTYNLVLKLLMGWGDERRVKCVWDEMERRGFGPDNRSYTIMIRWLYERGMVIESLGYFSEMKSKGMMPEPSTELLVEDMKSKLKNGECNPIIRGIEASTPSSKSMVTLSSYNTKKV